VECSVVEVSERRVREDEGVKRKKNVHGQMGDASEKKEDLHGK
jgi:hypothetical protein